MGHAPLFHLHHQFRGCFHPLREKSEKRTQKCDSVAQSATRCTPNQPTPVRIPYCHIFLFLVFVKDVLNGLETMGADVAGLAANGGFWRQF